MNAFFLLFIYEIISLYPHKSPLNATIITNDASIESLKHDKRPIFIQIFHNSANTYEPEERFQWEKADEIFPQVDFVSVICSYNYQICDQFYGSNSILYGYVPGNETKVIYDTIFSMSSEDYKSPQRFIDIIYKYDKIYPIGPPILKLYPNTIDYFYLSTEHPILLFYNSSETNQNSFLSAWSKAANEEIFPTGNNYEVGLLDCTNFQEECDRWLNLTIISPPTAMIFSRNTNNFEIYNSYDSPITYETIHGLRQNTDLFPPTSTPSPFYGSDSNSSSSYEEGDITVEEGYTLYQNGYLLERTVDQIRAIYEAVLTPPESPCEYNHCGSDYFDNSCDQINPSSEDHLSSLYLLSVFRWFAGLSIIESEYDTWKKNSQDLALNLNKIGYIPSYSIPESFLTTEYCGSENTGFDFQVSVQTSNTSSCFDSILKYFKSINFNNLKNRRKLLLPSQSGVGFGYFPRKLEYNGYSYTEHPSINVIKYTDSTYESSFDMPEGLDFISWPPSGYFPIDELSNHWSISHNKFSNNYNNTKIELIVIRDDGYILPIASKDNQLRDTLFLEMSDEAMALCEEFRTITVSIKNTETKQHILWSFELFNKSSCIDICFYYDDSDECPSKVNGRNRFGPGNYDQDFFSSSTSAIRIHVAQPIQLSSTLRISNNQKIIILGKTIKGRIHISNGVVLDFQDPSETDILVDWDSENEKLSGSLHSMKHPKSYSIDISEFVETGSGATTSKTYFSSGNNSPVSISNSLLRGQDQDIYFYFSFEDEACYLNTYVTRSYDIFYDDYYYFSFSTPSNSIQSLDEIVNYTSNKRIIREYSGDSSFYININNFMKGNRKRDYEFYFLESNIYFYCDTDMKKYANSITFGDTSSTFSDNTFKLYSMFDRFYPRDRCEIENITINSNEVSTSSIYFAKVEGSETAKESFPDRHVDIYEADSKYIDATTISSKDNCIIKTSSSVNDYEISIKVKSSYTYNSITIQPISERESQTTTIKIVDIDGIYNIPYNNDAMPEFYYENYDYIEVDNRLYYTNNNYHNFFHFLNCKRVVFINQYESIDSVYYDDHYHFLGGPDCTVEYGVFTIFENVTIEKSGRYHFPDSQFNNVFVTNSKQEFVKMKIRTSILINSSWLELNDCLLLDRVIQINLTRSKEWPVLILNKTVFKPSQINIDLQIDRSKLNPSDSNEYERHILIYGFLEGTKSRCDSVINKVKLSNEGNYKLFCSENSTYMYVEKGQLIKSRKKKAKLSGGAIAGIVLACVAAVAIIVLCIICCIIK